jgi:hypothetical protein
VAELPPDEPSVVDPSTRCLARWNIDADQSVLEEQRAGPGPRLEDFPQRFAAMYLVPEEQAPVRALERFVMGGTPLMWFTPDVGAPVVNAAVLTDLARVDATSIGAAATKHVGALTELGLGRMPGRTLAEFLVRGDVVHVYAHIGAELCLRAEREDETGYRAWFDGEHTYFTNEHNVSALEFAIDIAADGKIRVHGATAAGQRP